MLLAALLCLMALLSAAEASTATAPRLVRSWVSDFPWQLDQAWGIAASAQGSVYVTQSNYHRVQQYTDKGAFVRAWGSLGSEAGQFSCPLGITVGPDNSVYVADRGNHRIQRFTADGAFIEMFSVAHEPADIALAPDGTIYVLEIYEERLEHFTPNGTLIGWWGSQGDGLWQFLFANGVTVTADGSVYVMDGYGNDRVLQYDGDGDFVRMWGTQGSGPGQFLDAHDIDVAPDGTLYVADFSNHRIQQFTGNGTFLREWSLPVEGSLFQTAGAPIGLDVTADGRIFVLDFINYRVLEYSDAPPDMIPTMLLLLGD